MSVFDERFLSRMQHLPMPTSTAVAERAGPWTVVEATAERFEVRRVGESADSTPFAVFYSRELALLAMAALPLTARWPTVRLSDAAGEDGFAVLLVGQDGEDAVAGTVATFEAEVVSQIATFVELASDPVALSLVIEAAGATALRLAGQQLVRRLEAQAGELEEP